MAKDQERRSRLRAVTKRARLGDRQKEMMLAVLVRDRQAFDRVSTKLTPEAFDSDYERPYRLWWQCVCDFVEAYNALPGEQQLLAEVEAKLQTDPEALRPTEIETVDALTAMAYELRVEELNAAVAYRLATSFLEEKLVDTLRRHNEGDVAVDLPALLEEQAQFAREIASVSGGQIKPVFESIELAEVQTVAMPKLSTQIDFFDQQMRGGMAAGEVYGLVAPFGVGKTTIAVKLTVLQAKLQRSITRQHQRAGRLRMTPQIYLACWEEERSSVQRRLLSAWAEIPAATLEDLTTAGRQSLSTSHRPSSYKQYERDRYADLFERGINPPGEQERIQRALQGINSHIRFLDFTGAEQSLLAHAADMAKGLAQVIADDQEELGSPGVAMVVADHADAAADRHIEVHSKDPGRAKRFLLGGFPSAIKTRIAARWQCPVWILHQLAAAANDRPPGHPPRKNDHKEAKDFFEYCNFGWLLGTKTDDNLCVLVNGKHRRTEQHRNIVIFLDGATGVVRSANESYRVHNGRIVSTEDLNRLELGDDPTNMFGRLLDPTGGATDD